jgi:hypothetical protein
MSKRAKTTDAHDHDLCYGHTERALWQSTVFDADMKRDWKRVFPFEQ